MANTVSNKQKHAMGVSYILGAVKSSNKPIPRKDLMKGLDISRASFDRCIREIRDTNPNFKSRINNGHRSEYYWDGEVEPATPIYKYDYTKTEEGYADPTAAKAMIMFEQSEDDEIKAGGIYEYSTSTGKVDKVLVLASANKRATCITLIDYIELWDTDMAEAKPVHWSDNDSTLMTSYYCPSKMSVKPFKYFGNKISSVNEKTLNEIKMQVALYLDLPTNVDRVIEVPVEKIVEKEVPVEVEKIVEKIVEVPVEKEVVKVTNAPVSIDTDAISLALAKQRAEIYQDILEKLIAAKMV